MVSFDFFEVCVLNIHRTVHAGLGDYEVTGGLSTYPTCGHVGDFACRHKAVHILIEADGGLVTVDGHTVIYAFALTAQEYLEAVNLIAE